MTLAMLLMAFSAGVLFTCICYVLGAPSERDSNMGLMSLFAVILAIIGLTILGTKSYYAVPDKPVVEQEKGV